MPWLAEEVPEGQHPRVDVPIGDRAAHDGLPQKRLEENLCWIGECQARLEDKIQSGHRTEPRTTLGKTRAGERRA